GVAVHPAPLAAKQEPAQPEGDEQQPPGPRGCAPPAVLREEPEVALDVLREQAASVRRAADVDDLGVGQEPDRPARLAEAVEQVGLLAEHEEVLVEEAD